MAGRGGLGSLSVFLGLDTQEFTDGLSKAEQQARSASQRIGEIAAGVAFGSLIANAARDAAQGLKDLVFGTIDANDHLNDLSKKTGIAVETLGGIGFAAKQAGGDLESATAATGKLNKSLAEAAAGNKDASEAFKVLGVDVKDATGATKSADTVLAELADKFAGYADGPEKAALALRIFGKAGADIIPLLDDGGDALRANIDYFKRYSGVTAEAAAAADQFNDTIGKIKLLTSAFGQQLASQLLPLLQFTADAFLAMKEKGSGFAIVGEAIKVVFQTIVGIGSDVVFTLKQTGEAIGAIAAASVALAHGNFAGVKTIFTEYNAQARDARKELDAFQARVANLGNKTDGGTNLFAGPAPAKKAAPRLAAKGAGDEAAATLKKQLDGQLKLIEDFAKAQADALQLGNTYLAGVYQDGLVSQAEFFAAQKQVRDAALDEQTAAIDKEVGLLKAFAANPVAKQADRIAAEQKVTLLVQQRAEAVTKASGVEILANQQAARAAEDLADRYDALRAFVLAASGDEAGAAAIRNAEKVRDAARLVTQAQGDPRVVQQLRTQLDLQAQSAELQRQYAKLLDDNARREQEIYLAAQAGGKGELDTLAAIRDARTAALGQLQAQATAARAIADASNADADIKRANDLALALKRASAEVDPLASKFNALFEDNFADAFAGFLDGTKSATQAFRDFANSVISEIARIAARNLAKSIFGDTGGSSGIGGLLSSLFGGSGGSNLNYGNEGLNYGTPLASGLGYVPYDGFKASLHRGESVLTAKETAAASGRANGGVEIHNYAGAQVTAERQDDGSLKVLIDQAAEGGYQRGVRDLASGTGPMSQQLRARHGVGAGNLAKRG